MEPIFDTAKVDKNPLGQAMYLRENVLLFYCQENMAINFNGILLYP